MNRVGLVSVMIGGFVIAACIGGCVGDADQVEVKSWNIHLVYGDSQVEWAGATDLYYTNGGSLAFTSEGGGKVVINGTYWVEPQDQIDSVVTDLAEPEAIEVDFATFMAEFKAQKDDLRAFKEKYLDCTVSWQGVALKAIPDQPSVTIAPIGTPPETSMIGNSVFVSCTPEKFDDFESGENLTVCGKISSISILGAIVKATSIERMPEK